MPAAGAGRQERASTYPGTGGLPGGKAGNRLRQDKKMSEQGGDGPATILVAVDGSETSLWAAAYAAGMARRQHGTLVCLYVRTIPGLAAIAPGGAAAVDKTHDEVAEEIKAA